MSERPPEVDAAFSELGLSVDTRPEELRRAYLRVVKVRKPETDPEGFRKAREAFDLLTGWFQFLASRSAQAAAQAGSVTAEAAANDERPPEVEAAAPPAPAQPARPWDSLRPFLEARDAAGARARIRALLEADEAPPALVPILWLLLDMQRTDPGPDGRATLRALIAFVERARAELAFAQNHELWLLVKEVANLPDETPAEIERAIVEGIAAGSLEPTYKSIEAYTRAHPDVSDGLILPLSSKSPLLHQLLTPVLNIELIKRRDGGVVSEDSGATLAEAPTTTGRGWGSGMPVGALIFVLLWVAKFCVREVNEPSKNYLAMPTEQRMKALNSSDPLEQERALTAPPPMPAAVPSPVSALDELCVLSPDDCARAKAARLKLASGDCAGARLEYFALVRSPNVNASVAVDRAIRQTVKSLEPGLGPCHLP